MIPSVDTLTWRVSASRSPDDDHANEVANTEMVEDGFLDDMGNIQVASVPPPTAPANARVCPSGDQVNDWASVTSSSILSTRPVFRSNS